jgi:hypothetical protein
MQVTAAQDWHRNAGEANSVQEERRCKEDNKESATKYFNIVHDHDNCTRILLKHYSNSVHYAQTLALLFASGSCISHQ